MLKRKPPAQLELFIAGPLEQLVPDDHVPARNNRVLDLSWLHGEVADCQCSNNDRPGINPEVAIRLMLAGFLLGIVHDRRLLGEAHVNIAIRRRWGEARFRRIFQRTVSVCVDAGIAKGEVGHVDATLIRADASLATSGRGFRLEPCFKQHTAVDDENGVVLDLAVTTGEVRAGDMIEALVDEVRVIALIDMPSRFNSCNMTILSNLIIRSGPPSAKKSDGNLDCFRSGGMPSGTNSQPPDWGNFTSALLGSFHPVVTPRPCSPP